MFLTSHTAAAILIATKIQNPYLGFLLGLLSHFILDMIPHGRESELFDKRADHRQRLIRLAQLGIIDVFFAGCLLVSSLHFLKPVDNIVFFSTVFGAMLPDFLFYITDFLQIKFLFWFSKFHHYIHDFLHIKYAMKYGFLLQAIFVVLCLYLVFN